MSFSPDTVLDFWYPPGLAADAETHRRQLVWWMGGGANGEIEARFGPTLEAAVRGDLDHWAAEARGRLALVIVFDQFSRTLYRGNARAYAQDGRVVELVLEGFDNGHYAQLAHVWEKLFLVIPLGHSEELQLQERAVALSEVLVDEAPAPLRAIYEFSLNQARGHRDVIARFGRHPHRNEVLGRASTAAEQAYLVAGDFVHRRSPP